MKKIVLAILLILSQSTSSVFADSDSFLGPRDRRGLKSAVDGYLKHGDDIFRYGNWYGPGWWGGTTDATKAGSKPPVDSLDAVAQRHDFGYQVAEQQGKIYGITEEKRLKAIADYVAVRDAKALPENPKDWQQPPSDASKAARYRDRMVTGFAYEAPAYQGVAITGKGLDWATSPIENWELDRANQLDASDLEKQVSRLQNNWTNKNLPPESKPAELTPPTPPEKATNTNTEKPKQTESTTPKTPPSTSVTSNKPLTADSKELASDPDYIELMRLTHEMMGLGNQAMAQVNAAKIPSNALVGRITALQPRISALSKRIEAKYGKKYLGKQNKPDNKDKPPQNDGERGGTVYNKDGSKDVLHYEKDPDGKEVAVWTTVDKNGLTTKQRREK